MRYHREKTRVPGARGHTLVEAMLIIAIFTLFVLGIGGMLNFGFTSTRTLDDRQTAMHYAQTYMARLNALPFGEWSDGLPDEEDVQDFFENVTTDSGLSFMQLRMLANTNGDIIPLTVEGLDAQVEIEITYDLNGDGDTDDPYEKPGELYRIEIFYNGNSILRTYRATQVQN